MHLTRQSHSTRQTHPASTFIGKCFTILVGVGLSWLTLTNPDVEKLANLTFGNAQPSSLRATGDPSTELTFTDTAMFVEPQMGIEVSVTDGPAVGTANDQDVAPAVGLAVSENEVIMDPPRKLTPSEEQERIEALSSMLREMGATYLLVERMVKPGAVLYRVRCDLADRDQRVKCCLEATQSSPVAALQEVLAAARDGIQESPSTNSTPSNS